MYQSNTQVCCVWYTWFYNWEGEEHGSFQTAWKEFVHDVASVSCHHTGMSDSVFCGVTPPFLWDLVCTRFCLCPLRISCSPQSYGSSVIKSHWPSKSDSLGIPSPFAGSPGWEPWRGAQNLHNSGRRLVLFFSSLWVIHLAGAVILQISFVFSWVEGEPMCAGSHDFLFFGLLPCFLKRITGGTMW